MAGARGGGGVLRRELIAMVYSIWLLVLSLLFLVAERCWPHARQSVLRRGFWQDLFYLVFYGEYFGVLLGTLTVYVIKAFDGGLQTAGIKRFIYLGIMGGRPLWVQCVLLLLIFDLAQWLIHNLLHRVERLWEFHKVHHSIEEMDWLGNWRFHWMEVVVYRSLLYVPAAFFGFSPAAMFSYGVLNTLIGHFAHSNLKIRVGFLRYVINTPELHRWHHAHPDAGPADRNFGIALSVWDWLFGTAYAPPGVHPRRLGFERIEKYPTDVLGQMIAPFRKDATQSR